MSRQEYAAERTIEGVKHIETRYALARLRNVGLIAEYNDFGNIRVYKPWVADCDVSNIVQRQ